MLFLIIFFAVVAFLFRGALLSLVLWADDHKGATVGIMGFVGFTVLLLTF